MRPIQFSTEPGSRSSSPKPNVVVHSSAEPQRRIRARDRSPSPLVETSFVGKRQMTRQETELAHRIAAKLLEQEVNAAPPAVTPQSPKRPVKYANEPRSRPISPSVSFLSRNRPSAEGRMRSPSPMRMQVETSFCGKQQSEHRQKSQDPVQSSKQPVPDQQHTNLTPVRYVTEPRSRPVSPGIPFNQQAVHASPVKYRSEPRSRPVSPSFKSELAAAVLGVKLRSERTRSPSPNQMKLETSFVGSKQNRNRDPSIDIVRGSPHMVPDQEVVHASPVKYRSEPRSRPVSPSFKSELAAAVLDLKRRNDRARSPSPNQMKLETSFVGSQANRNRDPSIDVVRGSPYSVPDQEVVHASPVKYRSEPRSRPVSPSFQKELAEAILGSKRRTERAISPSPNPMQLETSFVGSKQNRNRDPSIDIVRGSPHLVPDQEVVHASPVKYKSEPRSRPVSPSFQKELAEAVLGVKLRSERTRSPSPNQMKLETSFVGSKQSRNRDPSIDIVRGSPNLVPDQEVVHASPVKYKSEPRSRPVSPSFHKELAEAVLGVKLRSERTRSPSPNQMKLETSFVGSKQSRNRDPSIDFDRGSPHPVADQEVVKASPVKYNTEPRSRPVSPSNFLSNACTDRRACRSPSPSCRLVETSFVGPIRPQLGEAPEAGVQPAVHPVPDQEVLNAYRIKYSSEPRSRPVSPTVSIPETIRHHILEKKSSSSQMIAGDLPRTTRNPAPPPPPRRKTSIASSASSPIVPASDTKDFEVDWERQFHPSSEILNLQLSHSSSGMVNSPSKLMGSGRSKPVACPRPPANFVESAQNSPTAASPALIRRAEGLKDSPTTPSLPSSPVPTRRISFSSVFRRGSISSATEERPTITTTTTPTSGATGDVTLDSGRSKESKSRSVLSLLFGKKTKKKEDGDDSGADYSPGAETSPSPRAKKNSNKAALKLPIPSRESSPRRSMESADDMDDDADEFRHQVRP